MKKIYIILFLVLTACSLDVPIGDRIPVENFYKTEADFILALNGAYDMLGTQHESSGYGTYFRGLMIMGRAGTDEGYIQRSFPQWATEISNYNFTSLSIVPDRVWAAQYKGVARCNAILNRIDNAVDNGTVTDLEEVKRIKGEAHFLRAFYYFQLVRFYGKVPIYLGDIEDVSELPSVDLTGQVEVKVYDQIISDFKEAKILLPDTNENGRPINWAASAFLAKVYLQMSGEPLNLATADLARAEAKEVILKSGYKLLPNYSDVFNPDNEYSKEHIFSVQYTFCGNCEGGQVGTFDGVPGGRLYYSTFRTFKEQFSSYLVGDLRSEQNVARYNINNEGVQTPLPDDDPLYFAFKFRHPTDPSELPSGFFEWQSPINFPLLRYSDILLTYAEATLRSGVDVVDGLEHLNKVRRRAFGKDIETIDLTIDLSSLTYDNILEERKLELCFEGHRWHDLVRHGKLLDKVKDINYVVGDPNPVKLSTAGDNIQKFINRFSNQKAPYFPIPQSIVQNSKGALKQNDGY